MYLSDFTLLFFTCILNLEHCGKVIDICSSHEKSFYVTFDSNNVISTWDLIANENNVSKCEVELVACSSCVISAKIWLLELSTLHEPPDHLKRLERSCTNDRLEITEPLQKTHIKRLFCPIYDGNNTITTFTYFSQTKSIAINFYYRMNYSHPFILEYTIKRNIRNFEITPEALSFENTITTPFFPIHYPPDYRAQYNIRCSPKIKEHCRIQINFLDYQIAPQSLLEFFENRSERIGITTGRIFRPPIIISNGRALSINFYANKATSFGFKFNYSAILGEDDSISQKPETTCGGYVENVGGTIVMTKMATEFETVAYDCIWLLKPLHADHFKSHLLVKIISFVDMGHNSRLEIHQGLTSGHGKAKHVSFKNYSNSTATNEELIGSINMGFYIYLHGLFNFRSRFIVSYSAFSFSNFHETRNVVKPVEIAAVGDVCYISNDFLCHNHRCISGNLRCDGFDHCGDNSDELQCTNGIEEEYYHQQNYYFPKTESLSYFPRGLIFAFFITISIFILCSLICVLVQRTQQPYELNRAIGTLNQMIAEQTPRNNSNETASNREPPPSYESPPNYQEIMEMQMFLGIQKKRSEELKRMHNRSTRREFKNDKNVECSPFLIVSGERESIPSSSSDDDSYDADKFTRKKSSILQKDFHAKNSFDPTTSNDSDVIGKINEPEGVENKIRILLSKSANNLVHEHSDCSKVRLARSVEGLSS